MRKLKTYERGLAWTLPVYVVAVILNNTMASPSIKMWFWVWSSAMVVGVAYITQIGWERNQHILKGQGSAFEALVIGLFAWVLIPIDLTKWILGLPGRFVQWLKDAKEAFLEVTGW